MQLHRTFLAALSLVFLSIHGFSFSDKNIDSLEIALNNAQYDTSRVLILTQLAFEYGFSDNHKAIKLIKQALELADEASFTAGLKKSQYTLGRLYYEKGELDSAMMFLSMVRPYYEGIDDKSSLYNIHRDIAQIHQSSNKFDDAIYHYTKSLEIAEETGDARMIGNSNNDLGSFYIRRYWDIDEDTLKDDELLDLATKYLLKAKIFFEKANYKRGAALSLGNLSLIAFERENYHTSLEYSQEALNYFKSLDEDIFSAIAYNQISKCYMQLNQLDNAEKAAMACLEIGENMGSNYEIKDGYGNLAMISAKRGDFKKAYEYQDLFNKYENEIINQESQSKIDELEQEYQAAQREKEIATLNTEKAIQQEHIGKQKLLLIFSFIFLGLFIVIIILLFKSYRQKKSDNLLLSQQKDKIELQNRELARMNDKVSEQNEKIRRQNKKLRKLYDDHKGLMLMIVHDLQSPFNKIKGLSNILNLSVGLTPEQKEINDKIEQVAESGRSLISDLTSVSYFEDDNIKAKKEPLAVNEIIVKSLREFEPIARKKGIVILFSGLEEDLVIQSDPDFINRILDNLISNAVKYSPKSKRVFVNAFTDGDNLCVEVKDQGPGINKIDQKKLFGKFQKLSARPTAGENSTGLGLSIVKTLVEKINGEIKIESEVGVGSSFIICIPQETVPANQL